MRLLLLCPVILFSTASVAGDGINIGDTGNELIQYCNDAAIDAKGSDYLACVMYVDSAYNATFSTTKSAYYRNTKDRSDINALKYSENFTGVCMADQADVTRDQMARVVAKYLKEHPEHLNWNSEILILDALHDAWPCKTHG